MKSFVFVLLGLLALSKGGQSSERDKRAALVVNGQDVKLGERPYQVSIQQNTRDNRISHFCGGSIISAYYVVTAAHCVPGKKASDLKIVTGTIDLRRPGKTYLVSRIRSHRNYQPRNSNRNDIALLRIRGPIRFTKYVQAARLPTSGRSYATNSRAVVSGWGRLGNERERPDILQKAEIFITSPTYCKRIMATAGNSIHDTQLCANHPSFRRGHCRGDSGGPLTVNGVLAGIVSWSIKDPECASTRYPGIYTKVSKFVAWIRQNAT